MTGLRPVQLRTLGMCTLVMMIDGYDLYLVGWILPALSDEFHVTRVALTPVLLLQQVGMLLGGYLVAPLADYIGRRSLLLICLVGIGIFSFGATTSSDPTQFILWRILTGLFAAAIVPNLLTLSSEVAPDRLRATFCTITLCGAMAGALVGAAMQAFILPSYGWHGAVILGGVLPLAVLPVAWLWLPESPRFRRDGSKPGLQVSLEQMLGCGNRGVTLLLWAAFISSFAFIGQWGAWSTTVFKDVLHMEWRSVAMTMTVYTTLGVIGTLSIGIAIDRFGFRAVLPTVFLLGFLGALGIGASASTRAMWVFLGVMSFFQVASQAGLAALAPSLYPPERKATGVGWAYGAGRIGSLIGPAIGSALIQMKVGPFETFIGFGLPLLFAAVILLFVFARA